jgi:2-polyprenyl-6-hydroxyphenyl methylase / 3-demethylubiquinone-9 3-methyltransferase
MLWKHLKKAAAAAGTASPEEIARFNALADEWWRPEGAFRVMHAFNAARVAHLSRRLPVLLGAPPDAKPPLAGKSILDVGCAAGLVSEPLSQLGADILGIDAAERNILVARRHAAASGAGVEYRHALPEDLVAEGRTFDAVLALEVVEHVPDLGAFLAALARLVTPGGVLAIGTLNRTARSLMTAVIGAEYVLRWLPRGTHDWRKFVTPRELELGLAGHGFAVIERAGIALNPLTRRWFVARDCGVAYLQFHRKRSGLEHA